MSPSPWGGAAPKDRPPPQTAWPSEPTPMRGHPGRPEELGSLRLIIEILHDDIGPKNIETLEMMVLLYIYIYDLLQDQHVSTVSRHITKHWCCTYHTNYKVLFYVITNLIMMESVYLPGGIL